MAVWSLICGRGSLLPTTFFVLMNLTSTVLATAIDQSHLVVTTVFVCILFYLTRRPRKSDRFLTQGYRSENDTFCGILRYWVN